MWNVTTTGRFVSRRATSTRAKDRAGTVSLWAFVATLAVMYVAGIVGPPPPSVGVLIAVSFAGWLFLLWGHYIERRRETVATTGGAMSSPRNSVSRPG